jgi:hypothetical protein
MPPPRRRTRGALSTYDREMLQAIADRRLDPTDPDAQAVLQRVNAPPTDEVWLSIGGPDDTRPAGDQDRINAELAELPSLEELRSGAARPPVFDPLGTIARTVEENVFAPAATALSEASRPAVEAITPLAGAAVRGLGAEVSLNPQDWPTTTNRLEQYQEPYRGPIGTSPPDEGRPPVSPTTTAGQTLSALGAVLPWAYSRGSDLITGEDHGTPAPNIFTEGEQPTFESVSKAHGHPEGVQAIGNILDWTVDPTNLIPAGKALGVAAAALPPPGTIGTLLDTARRGTRGKARTAAQLAETQRLKGLGKSWDRRVGTRLIAGQQAGLPRTHLLESDYANVGAMMERHPDLAQDLPYLSAPEVSSLSRFSADKQGDVSRLRMESTPTRVLQAAAKGGEVKRGWYSHSRAAIDDIYKEDAEQFTALLAALSPRTSVESDALNSVTFFENWVALGKPRQETALQDLLTASVQQSATGSKVLPAWRPNVTRAMQEDLGALSGPKVEQFRRNLTSEPVMTPWGPLAPGDAYTADAWAAGAHQFEQSLLGGRDQLKSLATPEVLKFGDADTTAAYLRATADARRAGWEMSKVTGDKIPWSASELQEAKWSYFKSLYELSAELNTSAVDVVKRGLLTSEHIAGTPDLTMLGTGKYGEQISRNPTRAARIGALVQRPFPASTPTSPSVQALQLDVAQIIDDLQRRRRLTSEFIRGVNRLDVDPPRMLAANPQEVVPAAGARLPALSSTEQSAIRQASTDATDVNVIAGAISGQRNVIPSQGGVGVYGSERNPLQTVGTSLRTRKGGGLTARSVRDQNVASRITGGLTGQADVVWNATSFEPGLPPNVLHAVVPRKLSTAQLEGVLERFPNMENQFALVDRGNSFEVIRIDGGTFSPDDRQWLESYLEGEGIIPQPRFLKSGEKKNPQVQTGSNLASDDAYQPMGIEGETGSRQVVETMFKDWDDLSLKQKRGLDRPQVKRLAGVILESYRSAAKRSKTPLRPDFENMLTLVRDGGISGLRSALADQSQLLPVLAALGISHEVIASAFDTPESLETARPNPSR